MLPIRRFLLPAVVAVLALAPSAHALPTQVADCVGPAGEAQPGTPEWDARDRANMLCAHERLEDQYGNPAFGALLWGQTATDFPEQNLHMLGNDTTDPHLTLSQFVPGGRTTDPFRTPRRWTGAGRGQIVDITYRASDGAKINGHLFRPQGKGPFPGIVITTGSIQGYQQMYYWAAEGLAEAGYLVMTYDVQGQGDSGTFPGTSECSASGCTGVPFQQSYNFYQGAIDSLNWFKSEANPLIDSLDQSRIGIAGHSLGAGAVSHVGQCYPGVKAIVAWDNLAPASAKCTDGGLGHYPAGTPDAPTNKVPALGLNAEYFFNASPQSTAPDAHAKWAGFQALRDAGTDAEQIALRSSTHLEFTYVPYILPASRLGERVSMYYTLAWFDRYVKGDHSATDRLTATKFDGTADASAIGAGHYDPAAAAANPTDPAAGNVPWLIKDLPIADRLSVYYASAYSLGNRRCDDMRHGC